MSITTMKQALEALEEAKLHIWLGDKKGVDANIKCHQTITALRQAIEEAEQAQPVAHSLMCVCGAVWDIKADGSEEMVHTPDVTPPRQPLTHPQIHELDWPDGVAFEEVLLFVRAIEAAHGIKGEA